MEKGQHLFDIGLGRARTVIEFASDGLNLFVENWDFVLNLFAELLLVLLKRHVGLVNLFSEGEQQLLRFQILFGFLL